MKIEIKGDDKEKLTISNEDLDNENFVIVKTYESGLEVTIPIDQLLSAVSSFIELRNQQWQSDEHYSRKEIK